jgi:rRNA maturation RNase YbeY
MSSLTISNFTKRKIYKRAIRKVVREIRDILNFEISDLEINFVDSKTIHAINKQYLKHDYTTDIITFNYSGDNVILEGEIFISVNDAEENAKRYKVTLEEELVRLIVHGILHMLGYDDIDERERRRMKRKENELVRKIWRENLRGSIIYDS